MNADQGADTTELGRHCGGLSASEFFRALKWGDADAHIAVMGYEDATGVSVPARDTQVSFDRRELSLILGVYGRFVAAGIWRDYAIDALRERAVFSVFRRAAEHPLYRVEKCPKNAARQGAYSVVGMDGRILKRGRELDQVLRVFDRKLIRAVDE